MLTRKVQQKVTSNNPEVQTKLEEIPEVKQIIAEEDTASSYSQSAQDSENSNEIKSPHKTKS